MFKANIYEFLSQNIKNCDNNPSTTKGINYIIDNMKPDSYIKRYIILIDKIIKNFEPENKLLCEILVTNPLKYKELVYLLDSNLNISPLPKDALDFYALKNYSENEKKFSNYAQNNDSIEKLRLELLSRIETQDSKIQTQNAQILAQNNKIAQLNKEVDILKKESNITKEALFYVQIRDVIKAFIKNLLWIFHVNNSSGDHVAEVKKNY